MKHKEIANWNSSSAKMRFQVLGESSRRPYMISNVQYVSNLAVIPGLALMVLVHYLTNGKGHPVAQINMILEKLKDRSQINVTLLNLHLAIAYKAFFGRILRMGISTLLASSNMMEDLRGATIRTTATIRATALKRQGTRRTTKEAS